MASIQYGWHVQCSPGPLNSHRYQIIADVWNATWMASCVSCKRTKRWRPFWKKIMNLSIEWVQCDTSKRSHTRIETVKTQLLVDRFKLVDRMKSLKIDSRRWKLQNKMECGSHRVELMEINQWKIGRPPKPRVSCSEKYAIFTGKNYGKFIASNVGCYFWWWLSIGEPFRSIFGEHSRPDWGQNALYCHVKTKHFHHIRKMTVEKMPTKIFFSRKTKNENCNNNENPKQIILFAMEIKK